MGLGKPGIVAAAEASGVRGAFDDNAKSDRLRVPAAKTLANPQGHWYLVPFVR